MSIVIAILMFGFIILVHELGHFIAAKASGITVLQFTIGFGPALWKKKVGDTLYAIRIIPLGGAVMMKGTDDEEAILVGGKEEEESSRQTQEVFDPALDKGNYQNAPKWKRFIVCAAGSAMNLLVGLIIVLIIMLPVQGVYRAEIGGFMEGFPYGEYFQEGDKIVKINNVRIFVYDDVHLGFYVGEGESYDIVVQRDGKKILLEDVPLEKKVLDADGTYKYGFQFVGEEIGFGGKIKYAFSNTFSALQSSVVGLQMIFTGKTDAGDMMGTIGIANEISVRAKESMTNTWHFVSFISIGVAFMNMLPIPALDGGKILFLIIEAIRRKPMNPKVEGIVSMVSLGLILLLFVFVTYNDIVRIIGG